MINNVRYLEQAAARWPDRVAYESADAQICFGEALHQTKALGRALCAHIITRSREEKGGTNPWIN
ncbi:hypothetical protein LJC33_03655 [Eubacteriales bacterium OttesenSCG-928-N13]|nr:hypothetical protein [Eubacteriales bacterium OttesenSCG-928-N13]